MYYLFSFQICDPSFFFGSTQTPVWDSVSKLHFSSVTLLARQFEIPTTYSYAFVYMIVLINLQEKKVIVETNGPHIARISVFEVCCPCIALTENMFMHAWLYNSLL